MTYNDPQQAFDLAIRTGRLHTARMMERFARTVRNPFFVSDFMYMGTDDSGRDLFKHIVTRRYLP